ncbi:hypothetical protein DOY81_009635 [Sarcophaga bullata]|nr:hypothetical protein DOY81_009635 [Sarcophaga bullata]
MTFQKHPIHPFKTHKKHPVSKCVNQIQLHPIYLKVKLPNPKGYQYKLNIMTVNRPYQRAKNLYLMDKIQKEKFQRLLAQQEEEQRRLQHSFEMQQKLLLEQLNRDMSAHSLKSQNNSSCNSSPRYKKLDNLHEKLNLTVMSVATKPEKQTTSPIDFKQHKTHQPQPSSSVLNTKNPSQTNNTHHSSHPIHFVQSPHTLTLTSPHLSSMDYSNANTSFDISTLSTQTSPETGFTTPHAKQNLTNNGSGNKTVSSMSSTRRRLFPTEVNFVETPEMPLSSRSTASSSYSMGQRTVEQVQPLNQNNKNSLVTTNASSRRIGKTRHVT